MRLTLTTDIIGRALGCSESECGFTNLIAMLSSSQIVATSPGDPSSDPSYSLFVEYHSDGIAFTFRKSTLYSIFVYLKSKGSFRSFTGEIFNLGCEPTINQLIGKFGPPIQENGKSTDRILGELPAWKLFRDKKMLIHAEYSFDGKVELLTFSTIER